jgi:hypothetical protein
MHTKAPRHARASKNEHTHTHTQNQKNKNRNDISPQSTGKRFYIIAKLYINRPDPVAFMPVAVDTSGRIYDDNRKIGVIYPCDRDREKREREMES